MRPSCDNAPHLGELGVTTEAMPLVTGTTRRTQFLELPVNCKRQFLREGCWPAIEGDSLAYSGTLENILFSNKSIRTAGRLRRGGQGRVRYKSRTLVPLALPAAGFMPNPSLTGAEQMARSPERIPRKIMR